MADEKSFLPWAVTIYSYLYDMNNRVISVTLYRESVDTKLLNKGVKCVEAANII